MSTGLIVMATGRYSEFLAGFVERARMHVADLEQVFVLSDRDDVRGLGAEVVWLPWGHLQWPYPTLLRYHAITAYSGRFGEMDHLAYVDVDMRIDRACNFPRSEGTFAVEHPGFVEADPSTFPYERDRRSQTCVDVKRGARYVCGGVQGGGTVAYLNACAHMATWIDADLANGVVPVWHDESAWNRWCAEHPPDHVLPHTYCWPQWKRGGEPIIVALDKNHAYFRAASRREAATAILRSRSAKGRRALWRLKTAVRARLR